MCTRVTSEMHISHGTTICYKVVRLPYQTSFKNKLLHEFRLQKRYLTLFQYEEVEIGKQYTGSPTLTKQLAEEIAHIGNSVGKGFIHSFQNKEDAIRVAKTMGYANTAVIECIIPDETPYFEGIWGELLYLSYVSTNIKYVKRVY